jgi:hypothetical protein
MESHAIFSAYFCFCFWHFVRMLRSWQSTLFLHVFCKWLWFSWMTIRYNWCLGKFVAGSTDWTTFWFVMLNLTSAWPHSKAFWLGETTAHDGPSAKTY